MAFLLKILQGSERRTVERRARHYQREAARKKEDPVHYQVKQKLRRHPDPKYRNMNEEELNKEAKHLTDPDSLKEFFKDITHAPIQKLLQEVSSKSGSRTSGALEPSQQGENKEIKELQKRSIDEVGHLTLKLHLSHSDETPSILTKLGAALLKIPYGVLNAYLEIGDSNNKDYTYIVEFNSSNLVQPRRKRRIERTALEATIPLGGRNRINERTAKGKSATMSNKQRKHSASHDLSYACQALVTPPRERRKEEEECLPQKSISTGSESDFDPSPLLRPRSGCMRSSSVTPPTRKKKQSACACTSSGVNTYTGIGDINTSTGPVLSTSSTQSMSTASSPLPIPATTPSLPSISTNAIPPPCNSSTSDNTVTSNSAILKLSSDIIKSVDPTTVLCQSTRTSTASIAPSTSAGPSPSTFSSAQSEADHNHEPASGDVSAARSAPNHQLRSGSKTSSKEESQNSKRYTSLDNMPLLEEFRNSMAQYSQVSGEDLTEYVQLSLSKIILIDKLVQIIVQYNKRYYYHSITRNCQTFVIDVLQSFGVWENFRFNDKLEEYLENLNKGRQEVYKSHKSVNDRVKYLIVSGEISEITYDEARYLRSLYTIFHLEEAAIAPPTSGQAVCSDPDCLLEELEKRIGEMRPEGAMIPKMPEDYLQ